MAVRTDRLTSARARLLRGQTRLVEKNGRIRLLAENLTKVQTRLVDRFGTSGGGVCKDLRFTSYGDAPTQRIPLKITAEFSRISKTICGLKEQGGNHSRRRRTRKRIPHFARRESARFV